MKYLLSLGLLIGVALSGCSDDDGQANDNNQNNQTQGVCGDGQVDPGEACDDGVENSDTQPDACRTDCVLAYCGDIIQDTGEQCDEGGANSDRVADACRTDCTLPVCGDGVPDSSEECDDGGATSGDGCRATCTVERNWRCLGSPSVCECLDHFRGPGCGQCVVRVDGRSDVAYPDGLTWASALPSIQQGLDKARSLAPHCEVWVAEGTYNIYRYAVTNTLHLPREVGLYGGFAGTETERDERDWIAHPVVLDGRDTSSYRQVSHVITAVDSEDATIDGFVILGGKATDNVIELDTYGGGIHARGALLTIANCTFTANSADLGGALYAYHGVYNIVSSTFVGNGARDHGGAIYAQDADLTLDRCTLSHNVANHQGGGICTNEFTGDVQITSSVFFANRAHVTFGVSAEGGAIYNVTDMSIANSTFVMNQAAIDYGAIRGALDLTNNVFWDNTLHHLGLSSPGVSSFNHLQEPLPPAIPPWDPDGGQNVIGTDPLLVSLPDFVMGGTLTDEETFHPIDFFAFSMGDVIEVAGDGVLRTVTALVGGPDYITFSPPLPWLPFGNVMIENWGQGATSVDEDLRLDTGSTCIDTADDTAAPPEDRDGNLRVDVAGVGTNNTLSDRGAYEHQP